MDSGAQCAAIAGLHLMPLWCVGNWGIMQLVSPGKYNSDI